jgi:hypothetical protein
MRAGTEAAHVRSEPMIDRHALAVLPICQAGWVRDLGNTLPVSTTARCWPTSLVSNRGVSRAMQSPMLNASRKPWAAGRS